ncbi:glycosyl hydrolase family 28-related protein [Geodermatophilus sp. CPCC 205761]|uniref:glycosyl hydrolase family 28-related protein n=1 Tax=Geodermatophilus sp. CPCC 205761 TaxID=2936597 RepID=UPI003EEFAB16
MDVDTASPPPRSPILAAYPVLSRRDVLVVGGLAALPLLVPWGHPRASGAVVLNLRDYGAVGDGVADDTAAVQKLMDATATQAAVGVVPAGTYRCTSSLHLRTGVQLQLESGSKLLKDWAVAPGLAGAFLRNADFAARANAVRITGPGTIGARDHSRTGVILAVYGDDVLLRDFTIDTYAGGQAVMFAGDRGRMERVRIVNSARTTGTGGIRVIGGTGFLATACHVESGDDALQFVPIGDPSALLYDLPISGGSFVGCTGASTTCRFMVALLEWTGGDTAMRNAAITDCSFRDCRGKGANRGIVVKNSHGTKAIARLSFTDCAVDMAGAADAQAQEIRIQTEPGRGAITDLTFTRTSITNPVNSVLRTSGPGTRGVTFDQCTFAAPSGGTDVVAVVDGGANVRMRRSSFAGTRGKRVLVAGPIAPVGSLTVEECRFTDIGNDRWGVDLVAAPGARVATSTFTRAAGTTTARAVRVSAACSGVVIEGNDLTGLTSTTKITDNGTGTIVRNNRGA